MILGMMKRLRQIGLENYYVFEYPHEGVDQPFLVVSDPQWLGGV